MYDIYEYDMSEYKNKMEKIHFMLHYLTKFITFYSLDTYCLF